jgi:hypothetical protein
LLEGASNYSGKYFVKAPWNWFSLLVDKFIDSPDIVADDAVTEWEEFERFVTTFLAQKSNLLIRHLSNQQTISLYNLLEHGLMNNSTEANLKDHLFRNKDGTISYKELSHRFPESQAPDDIASIENGNLLFKNAPGGSSDSAAPLISQRRTGSILGSVYVQYKNNQNQVTGRTSELKLTDVENEMKKSKQSHDSSGLVKKSDFFFLIVSSQPLNKDIKIESLPDNCVVVGPDQFDSFFGALSSRAHFLGGSKINLNYHSSKVLQLIDGVGEKTAQIIIDNRPYKNKQELENKLKSKIRNLSSICFDECKF